MAPQAPFLAQFKRLGTKENENEKVFLATAFVVVAFAGHASAATIKEQVNGVASVYSGERTANGEYASASGLTAAHKSLPFGTKVRVTNHQTGRSVVVRINDRGPFVHGRIIDLTPAGARALGLDGLAHVSVKVVGGKN